MKNSVRAAILFTFAAASFLAASSPAVSQANEEQVNFAKQVLPILSNKCFICHGPDTQDENELRLDSPSGATEDRGGYQAINPDAPERSRLLQRIHSADDPMPPDDAEKQLTTKERDVLSRWVRQGGKYTQHWAFKPPVADKTIARETAIDFFIEKQLTKNKIAYAPEADKAVLARRVSLILTGLPPESARLNEFLNDERPDAYERFAAELINDERFGEHQARYWLDAVRYGDTHGLHLDNKRGIYPYRDWVVKAFNDDLPVDDFITWQLAGDQLRPDSAAARTLESPAQFASNGPTLEQLVATGYVRLNPSTGEGGAIPAEFQMKNNFDRVETLGTVFLGLSLTCARCHTHKYDPIPQTEYYQLLAFFNSTAEPAMDGNKYEYGPTVKVPKHQAGWKTWSTLRFKRDQLLKLAELEITSQENSNTLFREWISAKDNWERLNLIADSNPFLNAMYKDKSTESVPKQARDLIKQKEKLSKDFTTSLIAKDLPKPRKTYVLQRGEYDQPVGDAIAPGVLSLGQTANASNGKLDTDPKIISFHSGGNIPPRDRFDLAKWLTDPKHPLVRRVLVNRLWQRTFGYGLVRTPEDFGLQGEQPTHPELLDWLAVNFTSYKRTLLLMVTSRTFKQSSKWRTDIDDPENRLFAKATSYRLDAEVIRDIGLWSSKLLDPHMGGEGVKPYQPAGMWKALAHPGSNTKQYVKDIGPLLYRRSLYVYWKRTSPHPMMTLFDAPDRESSCVRRSRTNTSLQSLGLLNETQRIEMGRSLAQRLLQTSQKQTSQKQTSKKQTAKTDAERLDQLFQLLSSRNPNPPERAACDQLLQAMTQRYANNKNDAVALLSIGDTPRDESLDVVQHAAWTQVAITVLASDAALLLY